MKHSSQHLNLNVVFFFTLPTPSGGEKKHVSLYTNHTRINSTWVYANTSVVNETSEEMRFAVFMGLNDST